MRKLCADTLTLKISEAIREDVREQRLSGAGVLVYQFGEPVCRVYEGFRHVEAGVPLREGSLFRLASMTKPVTAVAVLMEAERGALALEDEVAAFLPDFGEMYVGRMDETGAVVAGQRAERGITVRDLLTHCSGILDGAMGELQVARESEADRRDLESIVHFYAGTYLGFAPREMQMYNGIAAFNVAARIVEITSGMSYRDYVRRNILDPLGLADMVFVPSEGQWQRLVSMCTQSKEGLRVVEMGRHTFGEWPLSCFLGGAGLCGTLEDYGVFALMLSQGGVYRGVRILQEQSVAAMRTPYLPSEKILHPGSILSAEENWGLGVRVVTGDGATIPKGSFGWSGAYGTHFWIDPQNEIVVVYMKNTQNSSGAAAETAQVLERIVMESLASD